jgi:hypothetical protein
MNMSIYHDVMENIRYSENEPEESYINATMKPFANSLSSKTLNISKQAIGAISATPTKELLSTTSRRRLLMDSELDASTFTNITPRKRKASAKESDTTKTETTSIATKGGSSSVFVAIFGGKTLSEELGIAMYNLETAECILSQVRTSMSTHHR